MSPLYEKRTTDFYYRTDNNLRVKLGCNPHMHRHIEFVYMIEGTTTGYADTTMYKISQGDIFVIFPNQLHRFVTTGPERYMIFIVNPDMVPELSGRLCDGLPDSNLLHASKKTERMVRLLFDISEVHRENGELKDTILRGYLQAFFGELLRRMPLIKLPSGDTQTIKMIVDYCQKNYTRPLTLAMLEDELHISRYYISHLFGDKLNIGFNDYINSLRVTHACRCLRQTDLSITEISELAGFNSLRTFNRAFVKFVKVTPSDYRKSTQHSENYAVSLPT